MRLTLLMSPFRDHPRSRGVYSRRWSAITKKSGSSPLARGLLISTLMNVSRHGIIPARAGFTTSMNVFPWSMPDHPRSRGVYFCGESDVADEQGSSPLARGLLDEVLHSRKPAGIIPARAGFTKASMNVSSIGWDHPRSRGVYAGGRGLVRAQWGSSPLARGLPGLLLTHAQSIGIIPARAGFTSASDWYSLDKQDHPRSRGVYMPPCERASDFAGSSPLARGLPERRRTISRPRGIIPARAGFTNRALSEASNK